VAVPARPAATLGRGAQGAAVQHRRRWFRAAPDASRSTARRSAASISKQPAFSQRCA
jgi:hypothetical protein